jgi:cytochrome P450
LSQSATAQIADIPRFRPAAPVPQRRNIGFVRYMMAARKNPIAAFGGEAYEDRYVYAEALGLKSMLVNDPDAIKRILLDNVGNYVKGDQFLKIVKPAMGNSVLIAEGAEWRFQRRTASPMFQMRGVADCAPAMATAASAMLVRWQGLTEIDVASEMMRLTYDIICRTMFSNDVSIPFDEMASAFALYLETLGRVDFATLFLPAWVPTPTRVRGGQALTFVKKQLAAFVAKRRVQLEADPAKVPNDLLTLML